jgi:hypothetical protein
MIFDIILFDALYELSNESLFNVESSFRRNILKEHYNLESRPLNKGQDTYLFSQVGPPNPYWVDMYSSTIRFRSEDDTEEIHLENPRDFEIPIESRCFSMDTLVKEKYKSVEVWAKYFSDSVLLFESRIEDINYAIEPDVLPEYDLTTSYLAERESSSRSVIQNPASGQDLNRGMISVQFDQVFDGSQDKYLGLVINCEKRFRSLRLFLTNTFNEKASRYYINTLVPGKDNLILISIAGLKNIDQLTNTDFSSIQLHFYNSPPEEDSPYSVDIKDVVFFRSNYNLKRFLEKKPDLVFKEKEIGGFLY